MTAVVIRTVVAPSGRRVVEYGDLGLSTRNAVLASIAKAQRAAAERAGPEPGMEDIGLAVEDAIEVGKEQLVAAEEEIATKRERNSAASAEYLRKLKEQAAARQESIPARRDVPASRGTVPPKRVIDSSARTTAPVPAVAPMPAPTQVVMRRLTGEGWSNQQGAGYEVSSKGDRRFSALYARLPDGRLVEDAWAQAKGYPDRYSAKGKPALTPDFDYDSNYTNLWRQWAEANPELMDELASKAQGQVLVDRFAKTENNQARALALLLSERAAAAQTVAPSAATMEQVAPVIEAAAELHGATPEVTEQLLLDLGEAAAEPAAPLPKERFAGSRDFLALAAALAGAGAAGYGLSQLGRDEEPLILP